MFYPSSHSAIRRLGSIVLTFGAIVCLSGCHPETPTSSPQSLQLSLDNRVWTRQQKSQPRPGADYSFEYLPERQTRSDWNELITVQYFATPEQVPNAPTFHFNLDDFAKRYIEQLNKNSAASNQASNGAIATRTLSSDAKQIVLLWQGTVADRAARKGEQPPTPQAQTSLVRIFIEPNGLHIVQYVHKPSLNTEQISKWSKLLENLDLSSIENVRS